VAGAPKDGTTTAVRAWCEGGATDVEAVYPLVRDEAGTVVTPEAAGPETLNLL
jgi:hypothetical protein